MNQKWTKTEQDGYTLIENADGQTLGVAADSRVKILTVDGYAFKDFLGTGELVPYEDWRLSYEERAKDLAERISIEDIAGLMLYSKHQLIPAKGSNTAALGGTYGGKSYEESGADPWELTDQQKEFIVKDKVRHVLIMGLESTEAAVRWNNKLQALAENSGFGIPANNSSDPRHGAGSTAEYMGVTGEPISKWANGIGLSASFDPEQVREFGEIASAEYRALGIATALSPQIDLATEPRWMRFADTFGEHTQMTIDMTKAYCDGFQTTQGSETGWGKDSVNTMVKHFPGGGTCEGGRDAHYAYGKYAVYPGGNEKEHLKPFTEGAFSLDGRTGKASAVMPYYTISYGLDRKYGENVGNSFNKYLIQDLLREELGYEGVVCTDWGITHDIGKAEEVFAGKCWGVERLTETQRHFKALEAGVDQFGGNNDVAPVMEAYQMLCEKYGKEATDARFRRSAYRLLLNIFRTGLFENPYLDLENSLNIVGCKEFVEKGYQSQLKSVTLLKNKNQVLPLKEGIKVYVPDRFIKSYLNFMSVPTGDRTVTPAGKQAASAYFEIVDTPEQADAALCFVESPISVGYDPEATEADLDVGEEMRKRMGSKPVITVVALKNPTVLAELEPCSDALLVEYGVSPQAVLDVITGRFTPEGLLPVQMPADMEAVEKQKEDVAFDMECYQDGEGHTYDFGFGMNFEGVIADERIRRYHK